MPIRLCLFDMDEVLCHYDLGRRLRALSRLSGQTPRDIRAALWDSGFEEDADTGGYTSSEEYLAAFAKHLGAPVSRAQWVAARAAAMIPSLDVLALAADLTTRYQTAIYTNNGPMVKEELATLFPEAHAAFAGRIYCSYEFSTKKPDPDSYLRLLASLDVAPEDTFFTDDKKSNVEGASIAGLHAYRFTGYEGFETEARRLGLIAGRP